MWLIDNIFDEAAQRELAKGSVVAVGAFDGIHWGHRLIIGELRRIACEEKLISLVITFDPHPREVLNPDGRPFLITTLEEKLEILEDLGIEAVAVVPFGGISSLSPEEFVRRYMIEGAHARCVVAGYNHTFGRGGAGNVASLKIFGREIGYKLLVVPPFTLNGEIISSTKVRESIAAGDVELANSLLGRRYSLRGEVVKGVGRGRALGFPTANLRVRKMKLLPKDGVYSVIADVGGSSLSGIMNIGFRPTFGGDVHTVEVHIIGFSGDLYGSELKVELVSYLRDEMPFQDVDMLKLQIAEDRKRAMISL